MKLRYSSKHKLVGDDAEGEVIYRNTVILVAHNLWGHVPRRSTGICAILLFPHPGDSEVGQSHEALLVEHKILRFEVTMYDVIVVKVLEGQHDAGDKEFYHLNEVHTCLVLLEPSHFANMKS